MIAIQRDNVFGDVESVRSRALRVPLYAVEEYNQRFGRQEDWPGERSDLLSVAEPTLDAWVHEAVKSIPMFQGLKFLCFIHFRGDDSGDWIHCDNEALAGIIYINPTNLTSGTKLYNDSECVTDIKYVQNRLLMYSGAYPHQGYGHFGADKESGWLTINLFLDESQAGSQ